MIHGKGFKRYANGNQYDGEWVRSTKVTTSLMSSVVCSLFFPFHSLPNACRLHLDQRKQGVMLYKNGNMYEGSWHDGRFHGSGSFKWKNGDQFEGEFADGKMVRGTLTLVTGVKHTGVVKDANETTFEDPSASPPYPAPTEEPAAPAAAPSTST